MVVLSFFSWDDQVLQNFLPHDLWYSLATKHITPLIRYKTVFPHSSFFMFTTSSIICLKRSVQTSDIISRHFFFDSHSYEHSLSQKIQFSLNLNTEVERNLPLTGEKLNFYQIII